MKLTTAFPFAIFGGFFLAVRRYCESIGYQGFWWFISGTLGAVLLSIAGIISFAWLLDEGLPKIANFIERVRFPEVALASYVVAMDEKKLSYLISMQHEIIIEPAGVVWRANGVEMPERWILSHLGRCERYYPQLPAIRKQGNGTIEQLREQAFIEFGVMEGLIAKREGGTAIWVNDWTPEKVKEKVMR